MIHLKGSSICCCFFIFWNNQVLLYCKYLTFTFLFFEHSETNQELSATFHNILSIFQNILQTFLTKSYTFLFCFYLWQINRFLKQFVGRTFLVCSFETQMTNEEHRKHKGRTRNKWTNMGRIGNQNEQQCSVSSIKP